ncbi:MAG: GAF domain-containing protein, partial [Pyrinomonadaceae bacterium]|nr:GAF domain-containing protein [Sphingobacteriaceae bacterium]
IIKKRIDKANLKDTNERLTIPGKIAIVYSQDKEAHEYMNYLQYLQSIRYIGPDIEWVTLNDLQGLTGLKALRADVIYDQSSGGIKESKAIQKLEESIQLAMGNRQ